MSSYPISEGAIRQLESDLAKMEQRAIAAERLLVDCFKVAAPGAQLPDNEQQQFECVSALLPTQLAGDMRLMRHLSSEREAAEWERDEARKLLKQITDKTVLLSNRWPCPYCGRKNWQSELVSIEVKRSDGVVQIEGCWYCNLEPTLRAAREQAKPASGSRRSLWARIIRASRTA